MIVDQLCSEGDAFNEIRGTSSKYFFAGIEELQRLGLTLKESAKHSEKLPSTNLEAIVYLTIGIITSRDKASITVTTITVEKTTSTEATMALASLVLVDITSRALEVFNETNIKINRIGARTLQLAKQ